MEHIIKVNNLHKYYYMGKEVVKALQGIDLDILDGEHVALLGKSGSGKSTLLNMLAGLEKPTEGEILIKDYKIHQMNETAVTNVRKKHVGFIFQSYNLLPTHTALENVMLPLVFNNVPKKERIERASEMLKKVGLGDRLDHRPNQMSGGQQQRVSIARAFVGNPQIIFADEPTGNLDTKTTEEVMTIMMEMIETHHQTFIMVTHDDETADYADRVIFLKDGLIESISHNKINHKAI